MGLALALNEGGSGEPSIIGGRYRIEGRIAKGGMGAVYRVFDPVRERQVALKRLNVDSDARRRTRMFEREFHALAGLKHPRIIEVYDYGIDEHGAYYTMELLDGRDLRELAPLPYATACRHLRDVASSLSLLHARNLLHRDLSPRNVRITSDGRAKLIDFGALSAFGRNPTVVGTAPLVPPEGLYGGTLDQRADLYSLGALAYWMLTGRHAYEVRALDELSTAWNTPLRPPSELVPEAAGLPKVPAELDHLVLALLSLSPLARPASAAEVIVRLSTIAQLEPDHEPLSMLSYLHGGKTVGRARERAQLRKRLKAALAGSGSTVVLEAAAGMGASRIFSDLATEAHLLGATAVVVDASMHRGAYALAGEIARTLLAAQPDKARAAMKEHASSLAGFIPDSELRNTTQRFVAMSSERISVDPREGRMRTQTALLGWLDELAKDVPLLFAVHNFQRADDNSAALLSSLAHGIGERSLLLAIAYNPDEPESASAAHASLRESALHMRLHGFNRDEVHALVEATLGRVQGSERLAAWLHELTSGQPQGCGDLMRHLVEGGVIRFVDGVWTLPQELSAHDLPSNLNEVLTARIARLSENARRLAFAFSVHRGPVPLERCLEIAKLERVDEALKALTELQQRGVLVADDDAVRFTHVSVRDAVLGVLREDERRRLHAQLGALLSRQDSQDVEARLDAGWHLLHGGQEERGADLLASIGAELAFDADGMPEAIPALRAALEIFRKLGRSKRELARLLAPLASAGFFTDRKALETYGEEAAVMMQDVLGLSLARRLRPLLGRWLSTRLGLASGWLGFALTRGPVKATKAFTEAVQLFIQVVLALTGLGTLTLDAPRARRAAELLEPLAGLGPEHAGAISYRFASVVARLPEDRIAQTLTGLRAVLTRFESPRPIRGLPTASKSLLQALALYAIGALEGFRDNPEVLRIANQLEGMGAKLFELFANQIRANYYGLRGEVVACEVHRQRVEMLAVQAGSGWQAEVWAPTSGILFYMRTGDVIGMRRVLGQLERLAKEIPSLRRHAQIALAGYHFLRGDYVASSAAGEPTLEGIGPRAFIGWGAAVAAQVHDQVQLGNPERALAAGLQALSYFDAEDRSVCTMLVPLVAEVAWAEAVLGKFASAAARIDDYLEELGDRAGPTTRGILHETRSRVAERAKDPAAARLHLALMQHCFRSTENPALIARCERLQRELAAVGSLAQGAQRDTLDLGLPTTEHVLAVLHRCEGHQQRFDRALELLLEHTRGPGGYLLSYDEGELSVVSPRGPDELPEAVRERLRSEIVNYAGDEEQTASTGSTLRMESAVATLVDPADRYRTFVLSRERAGRRTVVAAAAIAMGRRPLRAPLAAFLSALAEGLAEPVSTSVASAAATPLRSGTGSHR